MKLKHKNKKQEKQETKKTKTQDYFPRGNNSGNDGDDFMFSKTPILNESAPKKSKTTLKRKTKSNIKTVFSDSEDDPLNYSVNKQSKEFIDAGFFS